MLRKILCLTSHNLDGPDYGATIRARNVFRLLSQIGEVRIVLANPYEFADGTARRTNGGFELLDVMRFQETKKRSISDRLRYEFDGRFINTDWSQASTGDQKKLQGLMAEHDLVWIHGLKIANGFGLWRWPNAVLDIDDIPSGFHRTDMAQATSVIQKLRRHRQMRLWRRREKNIVERFDALCVCSESDRQELGGMDKIFVVPNGFNPPTNPPVRQTSIPPRLGFIGTFQYRPNCEGVNWFIQQVWPQILRSVPQARLRLIGAGGENLQWPSDQNIDQLGFVNDVEGEMATWSLSVVPLFVGGGTRIKIAEAFSRKCPIVSTSLGAFGYDAMNGREILIDDSAEGFAAKCLQILKNPSEGERLAENAFQRFLENWTWDSFAGRIAEVVETVSRNTEHRLKPALIS